MPKKSENSNIKVRESRQSVHYLRVPKKNPMWSGSWKASFNVLIKEDIKNRKLYSLSYSGIFRLYFRFANLCYNNYKSMTKIKCSIILIFALFLSTSISTTPSSSDFCDVASNPGATAFEPNFVTLTQS
jgi:hypothetical protein